MKIPILKIDPITKRERASIHPLYNFILSNIIPANGKNIKNPINVQ